MSWISTSTPFLNDVAHSIPGNRNRRLNSRNYRPWAQDELRCFLEERCLLNRARRIAGHFAVHHIAAFDMTSRPSQLKLMRHYLVRAAQPVRPLLCHSLPQAGLLIDLLLAYGFKHTKTLPNGELMLEKTFVNGALPVVSADVLGFDRGHYPRFFDGPGVREFCVPSSPIIIASSSRRSHSAPNCLSSPRPPSVRCSRMAPHAHLATLFGRSTSVALEDHVSAAR